jgi:Fe-S cluster biogenesis protein NfuA
MREEQAFLHSVQHIAGLIQRLETIADASVRASIQQLVQSLMAWHGAALERIMALVSQAGEPGSALMDRFVHDDVVASLLLLYELHPLDLETRVRQALDKVRPAMRAHGGDVELLSIADGVVRLRLQGSGHGWASSATTLKLAIEEALYESAPDMTTLEVEGVVPQPSASGFVPLQQFETLATKRHKEHKGF